MKQKMTNKDMNYRSIGIKQNQLRAVKNNDGTTTVSGTAIVFNQPSQPIPFIEYISRDALDDIDFSKTLLLYAHDYNKILARADSGTLSTKIDDSGLHFTAKLPDTTLANDVRKDIGVSVPKFSKVATLHYARRNQTIADRYQAAGTDYQDTLLITIRHNRDLSSRKVLFVKLDGKLYKVINYSINNDTFNALDMLTLKHVEKVG